MEMGEFQALMARTYGERDRARGVPSTVAWLTEELGELAQAVRKGSVALMCCVNEMFTGSFAVGPDHADFENATCNGSPSAKLPFIRCPGSETLSAASPALEMMFAVIIAA